MLAYGHEQQELVDAPSFASPVPSGVVVSAPYNNAGMLSTEESAANPDIGQDAVDSLFD